MSRANRQLSVRVATLIVSGETLALAVPYLVLGPHFFVDDWFVLVNQRFHGASAGAGHGQLLARPGAWILYNTVFGAFGRHPLPMYLTLTAVTVGVGCALVSLIARLMNPSWALLIAGTYQLLPNHASLDRWISTVNIDAALALTATGASTALSGSGRARWVGGTALMVAGALCYEAVLPFAALMVLIALATRRLSSLRAIVTWVALGITGIWMVAHTAKQLTHRWADLSVGARAQMGPGLTHQPIVASLLEITALAVIGLALWRFISSDLRPTIGVGERLIVAGVLVVIVGAIPFVKFPLSVGGMNDRASIISSLGGAMVWTGVLAVLARAWRPLAVGGGLLFCAVLLATRWGEDRAYAHAGADGIRFIANVAAEHPTGVVNVRVPADRDGIASFTLDWDTTDAYQALTGDRSVSLHLTAPIRGGDPG